MNCLPCFKDKNSENKNNNEKFPVAKARPAPPSSSPATQAKKQQQNNDDTNEGGQGSARTFTFRELASATKHFRQQCLLGESGFGKVYKGTLATGQVVAVKQLDKHGTKGNKEFLVEVMMLSLLHHPNLVDLIGYCADGEQRLLVYEYMLLGSLKDHLFESKPEKQALDWTTRMKIASGTAQAMEYLHEKANPPVICRNIKSTNILLDENLEPKLTDYGLIKLEIESSSNIQQRVMGSYLCCAPEYERNGELTIKSDVYSFGVVLLELITGRRSFDTSLPNHQQNLVTWAQPYFRDPKRFPEMADPEFNGAFPERSLNQAVGVAAMCLQDEPSVRPLISDVVAALSFLTMPPPLATKDPPRKSSSSSSSESESSEDDNEFQNRNGSSSSESLYNENAYNEDEDPREELSSNFSTKTKKKVVNKSSKPHSSRKTRRKGRSKFE